MPTLEQVELRSNPAIHLVLPLKKHLIPEKQEVTPTSSLPDLIRHFDTNWKEEGLPQNWYNLRNRVGFSMRSQMELLEGNDEAQLSLWLTRTEMDIRGFFLEYLQNDRLVYPYLYERIVLDNGKIGLMNTRYKKDIVETAKSTERNGAVVDALCQIKNFFLRPDTPKGSFAAMVSPPGKTGLTTDDGKPYVYPDTYLFLFEKTSDTIIEGCAVRTDFSHSECRQVLQQFTGIQLQEGTPEELYVRTLAFIKPGARPDIREKKDVIGILQKVRSAHSFKYAYAYYDPKIERMVPWEKVFFDLDHMDRLYVLDEEAERLITKFKDYVKDLNYTGLKTKLDLQKAVAATLLCLSKLVLEKREREKLIQKPQEMVWHSESKTVALFQYIPPLQVGMRFGMVLDEMEQRPGCAGGGSSSRSKFGPPTIAESIVERYTIKYSSEDTCPTIKCRNCGWEANNSEAEAVQAGILTKCPKCGSLP